MRKIPYSTGKNAKRTNGSIFMHVQPPPLLAFNTLGPLYPNLRKTLLQESLLRSTLSLSRNGPGKTPHGCVDWLGSSLRSSQPHCLKQGCLGFAPNSWWGRSHKQAVLHGVPFLQGALHLKVEKAHAGALWMGLENRQNEERFPQSTSSVPPPRAL